MIKNLLVLMLAGVISLMVSGQDSTFKMAVGTFTSEGAQGMYLCDFNPADGTISLDKTYKAIDNPSFLVWSPNKQFLYVVTRVPAAADSTGGYVSAYKAGDDNRLQLLNKQPCHGKDPCHVDVSGDGRFVSIANYGSGNIAMYPVNEDGSLKPAASVIQNEGSGPVKSRQNSPHAHCIKFSPFGDLVFNADLGTDRLNILKLDQGKLVENQQGSVKISPGAGPRHFDFHPSGRFIYVINELNSTITAVKQKDNKWIAFQDISTLPSGYNGTSYCADIHVSPDGRYVYGSNRGHNSIAVFAADDQTGKLRFIKTVHCEGDWPRNFTLSPDAGYLLVANQKSGNITVFKIDRETGIPQYTGNSIDIPAPVCLDFR